jgi:hypothetical protein
VVFVGVLELCARIDDRLTWGAPFWGQYTVGTLTVQDELGIHGRPNGRFEKWRLNAHGFRGPEMPMRKPRGVLRVAVVGASETFGLFESPGMEYPAQLQRVLDAREPGRYQVLNVACPGMTPPRITHYFRVWVSRFEPDILLVYPSPAFYLEVEAPGGEITARPAGGGSGPSLRLRRKVILVLRRLLPQWVQDRGRSYVIRRQRSARDSGWVWQAPPPARLRLFRKHIEELVDTVQATGANVVLAAHANRFDGTPAGAEHSKLLAWHRYYPRASEGCLLAMEVEANRVLREIGAARGLPVVGLDRQIPKGAEHFADFAHFTDKGARLAAELLAAAVADAGRRAVPEGGSR